MALKSQINGVLMRVHFKEGEYVKKGKLLFTIDPRPYESALRQAEANLMRDRALLENAVEEMKRYEELFNKGYVSRSQYDQIKTNQEALEATIKADMAIVDNAKTQLSYCYIHSPINGKIGDLRVHEGNLIKANSDEPMATINQIQPIYVTFSVPEQYIQEIMELMNKNKLRVEAYVRDGKIHSEGILTFIDNTVDINTGTIKMKATFKNEDSNLWPGQFVNVKINLKTLKDALVVPSQAIMTGQQGQYVFIVKNDMTVEDRLVKVFKTINNETVIEDGLKEGEVVVTDGQLRLKPGLKVEIKESKK